MPYITANFELREEIKIHVKTPIDEIILSGEIVSQREPTLGRGIHYGVKFLFEDDESKVKVLRFSQYWRKHRSQKVKLKYKPKG